MGVGDLTLSPGSSVFLDRDGTLNRGFVRQDTSHPPATVEELEILPGVADALDALKTAGFVLVVVTNQPDVARGVLPLDRAERINSALRERLAHIDALMCCYHDDADDCNCRKPRPGMLFEAASQFDLNLATSFIVGDSWRDTEAGRRAGCATIQLRSDAGSTRGAVVPDHWADDIRDATRIVLGLAGP